MVTSLNTKRGCGEGLAVASERVKLVIYADINILNMQLGFHRSAPNG